jgi:protein-tyrosine phosphatase
VINLMEPDEMNHQGQPFVPYLEIMQACVTGPGERVAMDRFPIRDMAIPSRPTMQRILDKIDASIAAGVPVYLHCWGGVGRTGTVVGCYLVHHRLAIPGQAALDQIVALRQHILPARPSPETDEQRYFVRSWKPVE